MAPPPVTCWNPPGPTKAQRILGGRESFSTAPPRSHVRTRIVPQKPRKLSGAGKVFPPPRPGHMFEPAWSHKSPENFGGPGKFFHHPARSHVRTRIVPQKPRKLSGAGKVFPPPRPGHMFEPAWSHKSQENFWGPEGRNS